jgi:hypothetical protein
MARLLLLHPSLSLRRYAWTRPWPTRAGTGDREFGDVLVRVVLAPNAVIARFDPKRPDVFTFHDLDERPVSLGQVLADPSRLAAVLHVRTDAATPVAHRELVLCNESMIAEWSLATPEARAAIDDDAALLSKLASAKIPPSAARPFWLAGREADVDDGAALFASALAFDHERYRSTPDALSALADALRRVPPPEGPPLTVAPQKQFAFDAVVPQVPLRRPPARVARVV